MDSIDPFLDQEYEEDDDVLAMASFPGLPGTSAGLMQSQQQHQYSSAPSSSYTSAPSQYYPAQFEVPTTSFYGNPQQPAACTATMQSPLQQQQYSQSVSYQYQHPGQPTQYMVHTPMFNPLQQQQHGNLYFVNGQQVRSVIVPPVSLHQQYQQEMEQQQRQLVLLQQQQQQLQVPPPTHSESAAPSSSDHSYASYSDAMNLYDNGNSRDGDNFSPVEPLQTPQLRETQTKPMGRMIPKKRSAIEKRVGETDSASAAAVRRISTEEGWKSMNGWLKAAEQDSTDKENLKLIGLLDQCRQAKVTVTLLRSNDTPKFIRKLSKNHRNDEVRALSLSIVTRWKKVVNTTDVVEEAKEKVKKEPKKEEEETAEEEDNHEMKNRSLSVETRRSSDEGAGGGGEKKKEVKKDKEHRAKAKVYHSKGRSTGLFETEDAASAPKKRSINETSPPTGAPTAKKSSTEKAPGAATSTSTPPPKKAVPVQVKKVTTSSSFMDSLLSPAAAVAPKKKVLPKRPIPRPDVKVARPGTAGGEDHDAPRGVIDMLLSPNADGKVVMEGLFADTSRSLKDDRVPTPPKATVPVFVVEEPGIVVGRRKIRFADEQGGQLVETRFFEIEEGERINVNRYTPEEMKHHEAMAEKKYMKDSSGMHDDDEDEENDDVANNPWLMPCQTGAASSTAPATRWHFIPVQVDDRNEVEYGSLSQMKTIQEKRQMTAMMAFYNPNVRCSHFDEPENLYDPEPEAASAGLRTEPVMIPTESIPFEEDEEIDGVAIDEPAAAAPAPAALPALIPTSPTTSSGQPVIAGHLQALLAGLKTKGLLHDGSAAPADDPLYSMPPPPVMLAQQPQQQHQQLPPPQPVLIPTTSTYYQEQAPPPMNGGFPPNRMHSIQQEFPGQMPPPVVGMPPPMGAAASSSGIQVVNMDVHGPGAPQTHVGGAAPFPPYHPGPGGRPFYVSNKPCNFFNSPRGCRFGDKCGFAHVGEPNGGPPGGPGAFRGGVRGMRGGDFRGGPPRGGAFRGRGAGGPGFGPPQFGSNNNRDAGTQSRGDVDMRRGGSWRDERRERRRSRSRSRSPSPSRNHRDRDHRSSRREETKDLDLRHKDEPSSRPAPALDDDDIDGVPIESPVA